MMKAVSLLLISILGSALAAPAIVWKKGEQRTEAGVRTSRELSASDLLSEVLTVEPEVNSLASVVFVMGRGEDGTESLSTLASSGALPNVETQYNKADAIHHHVAGIESTDSLVRVASRVGAGHNVVTVTLGELNAKLTASKSKSQDEMEISQTGVMSKTQKHAHKRSKDLSNASVLVVMVDPRNDASLIDSAVVGAIEHEAVSSVVLTAVRSHEEVKHERLIESRRRLSMMGTSGRNTKQHGRRLEDAQEEDGENQDNQAANNNNGDDMTGVYYVNMTPNILAGILFTFLFAVITWIGVSCMGMIAGQDVYVKKMPPVGREA